MARELPKILKEQLRQNINFATSLALRVYHRYELATFNISLVMKFEIDL